MHRTHTAGAWGRAGGSGRAGAAVQGTPNWRLAAGHKNARSGRKGRQKIICASAQGPLGADKTYLKAGAHRTRDGHLALLGLSLASPVESLGECEYRNLGGGWGGLGGAADAASRIQSNLARTFAPKAGSRPRTALLPQTCCTPLQCAGHPWVATARLAQSGGTLVEPT